MIIFKACWLFLWTPFVLACLLLQHAQAMEFQEIKTQELKSKMDAGEKLMLVNSLSNIEFNAEHIPGSVNIPLYRLMRTKKLPKDPNNLIVTHCLGPE